jgi:nucleoside-diphosphate-sugar epimerase
MKKVLITGGAGFVGRRFCRRFLERGDEVHCVDSVVPLTGSVHPSKSWPLYDPRDFYNFHFFHEDCRTFFGRVRATDFDYVLHLAAVVGGRLMIDYNPLAVADDLAIDAAYWQWAVAARPRKTVYFSSSAAYPVSAQTQDRHVPLSEGMVSFESEIGVPDMTYGWAKLTGEYLAQIAHRRYGLESAVYRPFSGYGEDQDETYPFPAICRRALEKKNSREITVWGSGRQMRDFIHVEDCVDGVFATMDRIDDASALNLSTGRRTSFADLTAMIARTIGYEPQVVALSSKPEGVFARCGDTARQEEFGFRPQIPLETGIADALCYLATQSGRETGAGQSPAAPVRPKAEEVA